MRPVQFTLHDQWSQSSDPPLLPVRITPELLSVLRWWSLSVNLTSGVPLHQPLPDLCLFTDASSEGWGAHLLSHQIGGLWDLVQKRLHINVLELLAVRLALQCFLPLVQGQLVMIMTNNTTVIAELHNRGDAVEAPLQPHCPTAALGRQSQHQLSAPSHSGQAERYSRPLVTLSSGPQLRVDPVTSGFPSGLASVGPTPCGHVHHSRQCTPAHVCLSTFGPPGIADRHLVLHLDGPLDLPVSSVPSSTGSSTAHKSHSLSFDSDCPSVAVPALVSPAAETPCRPATPTPTDQNPSASTVVMGVPPGARRLSLHAWRLSGPLSNGRGFQWTWHSELLQHTTCQHSLSTTASGDFSVTGLPSRVEIHPLPLLPN